MPVPHKGAEPADLLKFRLGAHVVGAWLHGAAELDVPDGIVEPRADLTVGGPDAVFDCYPVRIVKPVADHEAELRADRHGRTDRDARLDSK